MYSCLLCKMMGHQTIIMAGTRTEGVVCEEEDLGVAGVMVAPVAGVGVDFLMVTRGEAVAGVPAVIVHEVVAGVPVVMVHEVVVAVVGQELQEAAGVIG